MFFLKRDVTQKARQNACCHHFCLRWCKCNDATDIGRLPSCLAQVRGVMLTDSIRNDCCEATKILEIALSAVVSQILTLTSVTSYHSQHTEIQAKEAVVNHTNTPNTKGNCQE